MTERKIDNEPFSFEDFEKQLQEEISVTTDFDLPLSALVALVDGGWGEDSIQRVLGALRVADLTAAAAPEELAIVLPNTTAEDARVVERRLREAVPEAKIGITSHQMGDSAPVLVERARRCAHAAEAGGR